MSAQPSSPARLSAEAQAKLVAQAGLATQDTEAAPAPGDSSARDQRPGHGVAYHGIAYHGVAGDTVADDTAADEGVPEWAARAMEQTLHVICWLDPGETGERYTARVRFTGQRTGVTGRPAPGDTFTQDETYAGIMPGSGPVAVTAEIHGINPGTWAVTARPRPDPASSGRPVLAAPGRLPPPRRIAVPDGPATTLRTANKLRSKVPGIIRYAYAPLCVLAVLVGLILEALLLSNVHYPLLRPVGFSVAAVAAGVAGGKTWYGAVHQWRKWDGWCIQGFVAGAAIVVGLVAVVGPGLPPGAFLAAATPALLIGMGIGRHACFLAGCCTGRPTAWRWGIWSSDRRLGCRRMPVQLYEAWTALTIGLGSVVVVLAHGLARSGPVAVMALAAYTLIRQGILGFRDEPRAWRLGRPVTATLAALALLAGVALLAV
ncbi:MAG TPA: prolipoprotein diacylglyceryl transferase family protein [Trebonia sp.]|nr:prolipoprotein diacylglyceryl transferase family protein [Trebonia sp.]